MESPPLRILCTEDHEDTLELMTLILGGHNCEVITAETPDKAMELARSENFDLYILDSWVPGMSGAAFCMALRAFDPETPVLFYSGAAYPKDKAEAFASGAQGYLVKPADSEDLVAEVFRLISNSRRHSASSSHASPMSFAVST